MGRRLSFLLQLVLNFFVGVRGSLPEWKRQPPNFVLSHKIGCRVLAFGVGVWRLAYWRLAYWRLAFGD